VRREGVEEKGEWREAKNKEEKREVTCGKKRKCGKEREE
jgi:hypothetical protein